MSNPHAMNPEMAQIVAEQMLAAHKLKHPAPQTPAEAFLVGAVQALMARVRINGVDWVNPMEVVGAPGVSGPEAVGDEPGPCGPEENR